MATSEFKGAGSSQRSAADRPRCRFFGTKNGCRAGEACHFAHIEPRPVKLAATTHVAGQEQSSVTGHLLSSTAIRSVQAPKPQVEDARTFQVGQIQRRFKPTVEELDGATIIRFQMAPTDPDFPYEIDSLDCSLEVPHTYPESAKPSLKVMNKDIPRGFQINIEQGFDMVLANAPSATLLGLMNRLDKKLEIILSGEMAQTVKLIVNRGPPKTPEVALAVPAPPEVVRTLRSVSKPSLTPQITAVQKAEAQLKRRADSRQLEARFGRLQFFSKAPDGFSYIIPLESPRRPFWPFALRSLRTFTLLLPELYPLEPSTILLDEDGQEARNVECAFRARSEARSDATLTQQINYLTQNLHLMAADTQPHESVKAPTILPATPKLQQVTEVSPSVPVAIDSDKRHIHVIQRPPEWTMVGGDGERSDISSSDGYSYDSGDDTIDSHDESEDGGARVSAPVESGVLLSFPHLELHGVELMEITTLNITVKCERCKDVMDIERLRSNLSGDASAVRDVSCKKCATGLSVGFRADLIHVNSVRAGYLDLEGCTVVDLLPSNFIPTCSECSTPHPAPGVVSVRGASTMAICRECHKKMTFRIPEVKFLQVSAAAIRASKAPARKKIRETLGIVAGTELPRRGRCTHYGKSYRWFRFSCCGKVFACDRCHDASTDHPNEHANRMICGHCSREQTYRPADCAICHSALVGKAGTGFWEGGKGTRDKGKMSRKDPRKYKRRGGAKVGK